MVARGFFETVPHPVVGAHPIPMLPFRYASVRRWLRTSAPTLGEHDGAILGGVLGLGEDELDRLRADGVIGNRPKGT
jgi:crotonobetainyl-CoA:carnitine CoA-transferase CaiB-like acyl-CoA transferase